MEKTQKIKPRKKVLQSSRASPYSRQEKLFLLSCIKKRRKVVENVRTDAVGRRKKNEAWDSITEEYNALCQKHGIFDPKTKPQLKRCWENMKSRTRKNDSDKKQYRMGTGGGPALDDEQDVIDGSVRGIKPSIDFTLENPYDSTSAYENHNIIEHVDLTCDDSDSLSLGGGGDSEIDDAALEKLLDSDGEMESDEEYLKNLPDFTDDQFEMDESSNETNELPEFSVEQNSVGVKTYNHFSSSELDECEEKKFDGKKIKQSADSSAAEATQRNVKIEQPAKESVQAKSSRTTTSDLLKNGQRTYVKLEASDGPKQKVMTNASNLKKIPAPAACTVTSMNTEKNDSLPISIPIKSETKGESVASTATIVDSENSAKRRSQTSTSVKNEKNSVEAVSNAITAKSGKNHARVSCSASEIAIKKERVVDTRTLLTATSIKSENSPASVSHTVPGFTSEGQENCKAESSQSVIKFAPYQNTKFKADNNIRIPLSPIKSVNSSNNGTFKTSSLKTAKSLLSSKGKSDITRSTSSKTPKKLSTTGILAKRLKEFEAITAREEVADANLSVLSPRRNSCSSPALSQDRPTSPQQRTDRSSARRQRYNRSEKAAHLDEVHAAKMRILDVEMECALMKKDALKFEQETHKLKKQLAEQQLHDYLTKNGAGTPGSDDHLQ